MILTRFSFQYKLTHVVIPQEFFIDESFISTVQGLGAYVLYHTWITESISQGKRQSETDHYVPGITQVIINTQVAKNVY